MRTQVFGVLSMVVELRQQNHEYPKIARGRCARNHLHI
jgi:hypothetical protein|tara:strand:+ start:3761 stop:3874 length:114 start_codon:yes stop_codon:yes gene_type:complete